MTARLDIPVDTKRPVAGGRLMRDVMGHFATGVSVVSVWDAGGAPRGATANAISSVSLDPPLLLVCLSSRSGTLAAIRAEGRFGVNILAAEQREHSDRFAKVGGLVGDDGVGFREDGHGVPVLTGALATVTCEVEAIHPAGDHEIVVGLARHLEHSGPASRPLVFYRGSYSEIKWEAA